jgi:hypothetical protein
MSLPLFHTQGWLKNVEAGGARREMENFEVALDGNIIAREPNGDVIEMQVPGWQVSSVWLCVCPRRQQAFSIFSQQVVKLVQQQKSVLLITGLV